MTVPALSLERITFCYDAAQPVVLNELTLDIPAGAVTALLGPNGSGKTTLLHVLLGWLPPRQGTVLLAGRPLSAYSRRELSRTIGIVPQNEHIPFDFSVLDYVVLGRAPYLGALAQPGAADYQQARQALDVTGLTPLHARSIMTLSGGEQQLAMIARALVQHPRILLLDEPTSHLDLSNRKAVQQLLRRLAAEGMTLVFTSHDPGLVSDLADHVILLRQGAILAAGRSDTVLTADGLSATYGVPVRVTQCGERRVILA